MSERDFTCEACDGTGLISRICDRCSGEGRPRAMPVPASPPPQETTEAQDDVMCDGNGECFSLALELDGARKHIAELEAAHATQQAALRDLLAEWYERIATSERECATDLYSVAGRDSQRGRRLALRKCIADVARLLGAEPQQDKEK